MIVNSNFYIIIINKKRIREKLLVSLIYGIKYSQTRDYWRVGIKNADTIFLSLLNLQKKVFEIIQKSQNYRTNTAFQFLIKFVAFSNNANIEKAI